MVFKVKDFYGYSYQGKIEIKYFENYLTYQGMEYKQDDILKVGDLVRIRSAKLDEKLNEFELEEENEY